MKFYPQPRWMGVAVLLLAGSVLAATASPPAASVKIIELRGDGEALGKAHGAALGPAIIELKDKYFKVLIPEGTPRNVAGAVAMGFESKLRPEHLAELRALATAIPMKESDLMLGNSFLDLMPIIACSTLTLPADAAPDHVARFARNLDFQSFDIADKNTIVLVYHPKGRYAFATIGWPGMIGAVSGMNEHGLTLSNMEVTRLPGLPMAMPYAMLYRCVLEECKTVDEAIAFLEKTPRQSANNLMLMDAAGNRAVVELTPQKVVVRRGEGGAPLISTNHQRGQDTVTPGLCVRYDYLNATAREKFGKIGRADVVSMLQHVQQGDMTMQSMIFEPANRVIYLATGKDAANQPFEKIELAKYFK